MKKTDAELIEEARGDLGGLVVTGDIVIPDNAEIERVDDGAWVTTYVWVSDNE